MRTRCRKRDWEASVKGASLDLSPDDDTSGRTCRTLRPPGRRDRYTAGEEQFKRRYAANDVFLGPDGKPRPELYVADKLHNRPEGYRIRAALVKPYLEKWMP